ncbi:hypothetical protein [Streptomyces sp. NPDC056105]|uniref:hypothetical protein n=1 Tax=Streptomyces sp. NPDC056105 TaxID=3345714 RepID=UPI0035D61F0C
MAEEVGGAAAEAFLDGFPIAVDLGQAACSTREGISVLSAAPFSVVSHAGPPAGSRDTFVSVDNDTSCSVHHGLRATGAGVGAGAVPPVLGLYPPHPEALAGPPLKTAQPA